MSFNKVSFSDNSSNSHWRPRLGGTRCQCELSHRRSIRGVVRSVTKTELRGRSQIVSALRCVRRALALPQADTGGDNHC